MSHNPRKLFCFVVVVDVVCVVVFVPVVLGLMVVVVDIVDPRSLTLKCCQNWASICQLQRCCCFL